VQIGQRTLPLPEAEGRAVTDPLDVRLRRRVKYMLHMRTHTDLLWN